LKSKGPGRACGREGRRPRICRASGACAACHLYRWFFSGCGGRSLLHLEALWGRASVKMPVSYFSGFFRVARKRL
jgi:hypothetical protein